MQELEKIMKEIEQAKREPWYRLSNYDVKHKLDGAINRIANIIRENMNDGWISVEERLPDESLNSVIGWDEYRERCCFVQYYAGKWAIRADREPIKITYWRPIPERPADKTEAPDWRERSIKIVEKGGIE